MTWLMDARIKAQIERVVEEELIRKRGATQEQIKRFFGDQRLRTRIVSGFGEMLDSERHPRLSCIQEAQTD